MYFYQSTLAGDCVFFEVASAQIDGIAVMFNYSSVNLNLFFLGLNNSFSRVNVLLA